MTQSHRFADVVDRLDAAGAGKQPHGQLADRIAVAFDEYVVAESEGDGELALAALRSLGMTKCADILETEIRRLRGERIVRQTAHGLAAIRASGSKGGRPPAVTPEKLAAAKSLIASGHTVQQAADAVGVGRATLYRALGDGK